MNSAQYRGKLCRVMEGLVNRTITASEAKAIMKELKRQYKNSNRQPITIEGQFATIEDLTKRV